MLKVLVITMISFFNNSFLLLPNIGKQGWDSRIAIVTEHRLDYLCWQQI